MHTTLSNLTLDPSNPRRRDDDAAALAALAESLAAEGQLEPLLVRGPRADGGFLVVNGGRRLRALEKLVYEGRLPVEHPVAINPLSDDLDAARLASAALAVNFIREDLHPVDAFEAFAALKATGFTEAGIAQRFGVDAKTVRHYLRLAGLAPDIRAAWRAGEIAADAAEAFCLSPDLSAQKAVFDDAVKRGPEGLKRLTPWGVKHQLVGRNGEERGLLTFVTAEAYEEAGGALARLLFDQDGPNADPEVLDYPLLKRLADEKIEAERQRLLAAGWGWVDSSDRQPNWRSYAKAKADATKTKEGKAKYGCVLHLNWQGKLEIERGLERPAKKKQDKPAKGKADAPPADDTPSAVDRSDLHPGESRGPEAAETDRSKSIEEQLDNKPLPASLVADLGAALTFAAQDAVREDADAALRLLIAALTPDLFGPPLHVTAQEFGRRREALDSSAKESPHPEERSEAERLEGPYDFAAAVSALEGRSQAELLAILARRLAPALMLTALWRGDNEGEVDARAVIAKCDAAPFTASLATYFPQTNYFARAGKLRAIEALVEIDSLADAGALMKKKAPELAAMAGDKAKMTGWLPKELRTAHYRGPGATPLTPAQAVAHADRQGAEG